MLNKFYGVSLVALSLVMSAGAASASGEQSFTTVTVQAEVQPVLVAAPAGIKPGALHADFKTIDMATVTADLTETVTLEIINNTTGGDLVLSTTSSKTVMQSDEKDSFGKPLHELPYGVAITDGVTSDPVIETSAVDGKLTAIDMEVDNETGANLPITVTLSKDALGKAAAGKYTGVFTLTLTSK